MSGTILKPWLLVCMLAAANVVTNTDKPLLAARYYFSALGHDQSGDGSELHPWRSISKFNMLDLDPGDSVYFRAGDMFNGSLLLDANDTGTDSLGRLIAPIVISSYGDSASARAFIRSHPTGEALLAHNSGGIELQNLEFFNGGTHASNNASGIQFMLDVNSGAGMGHVHHISIDNVVSRGFHKSGLSFYSAGGVGYHGVEVTNSEFDDNQFAGIDISAADWQELIHRDLRIDGVTAHSNPGFVGCQPHCGHGIVVGQVDGAVIENSVAHSNGVQAGKGNVGIWAWQSNNVTIERNNAYDNRSPNGSDGGGFDIDGGVTNSIVQYNVSRNNSGAGFLLAEFGFAEPMQHNVIRYNLSVNDGVDNYGAFTIWGQDSASMASSALFHNNTAIVDQQVAPQSRGTVWFVNSNHDEIDLINNVFVALNGAALVDGTTSPDQARFINNGYWTGESPIRVGDMEFASIAEWAMASQQEMLNGEFVGLQTDPGFGAGAYRPMPPSEVIDAGLAPGSPAWPVWFGGLGLRDLFGTSIPQGASVDVGAAEFAPLPGDYNRDGSVDAADYVLWRKSFDQSGFDLAADGNRDSKVDAADYSVWRTNFGRFSLNGASLANARSTQAGVPEPPSFLLFLAALVGIRSEVRKRRLAHNRPVRARRRHIDTAALCLSVQNCGMSFRLTTFLRNC